MKFRSFSNWNILTKINSISVATVAFIVAVSMFGLLPFIEKKLMSEKEASIKNVTDLAVTLVRNLDERSQKGEFSQDDARMRAREVLRGLRYAGGEYLFVVNQDVVTVMHPIKPELEGKSGAETKDPNGKSLFVEMVKVAKDKGAGTVNYMWPKPNQTVPSPKLSYIQLYKPWGWVIGTGIYIDDVAQEISTIRYGILGVLAACAVFIMILSTVVARRIRQPINEAVDASNRLSGGDLTVAIEVRSADETGQLMDAMQKMVGGIRDVVSQTVEAANQVSIAADQISEANQSFSQRITEQAAAVEETTASMEEMGASIKSTAENAREANTLARSSRAVAEQGTVVMADTIAAMNEINKSSTRIANISDVIGEIAFQTNLLALNAAVEAARAGEHGKGFAVVATEIRSLAGRTSQSAREITELIGDSGEKTAKGVHLAEELSDKLEEVVTGIKKVTDLMDEVAAAAQEQSQGINQVTTAMTQVDQTTQQNATLVEETSAAAEELAAQAKALLDVISFFRIEEGGRGGRPARRQRTGRVAQALPARSDFRAVSTTKPMLTARSSAAGDFGVLN